jgi:DNA modification methylase
VQKNNQLEKNLLICGDNLNALDDLIKKGIRADLIYLDPPFFSNKHYEVVWGDEAEVRSFKDRWAGGINVYIEWMKERVAKMYDILKDTGSFYLHCDWHASHYLRVMMDTVFSINHFRNEIIWKRTSGHSDAIGFGNVHDTILFYTKSNQATWNDIFHPYDPEYIEQYYRYTDDKGRKFMSGDLGAAGLQGGGYEYVWKGIKRLWRVPLATMKKLDADGHIFYTRNGIPRRKRYLDESKGMPAQDIWADIESLRSWHQERLGYPTQKPEGLLERIIKASSNKNDSILDPFCGCGTAMAAAQKLGRKWIGIDISPTAIYLVQKRLQKLGAIQGKDFEVIGTPTTLSELRALEPFEFQNWVINEMRAKQSKKLSSDFGLDGYYDKTIFTERAGIQVKQSENVGRNVVDNFETALSRGKFSKGFIVAFSFSKGANEEAARAKSEGLEIRLIKVEDLLLGKVKI